MRRRDFTSAEIELIRSLNSQGKTIKEVGKAVSSGYKPLARLYKTLDLKYQGVSKIKIQLTETQMDCIKKMQADGYSQKDIADKIGFSRELVSRVYEDLGLLPIQNGSVKNNADTMKQIIDLYNTGTMSNNAIAKELGKPHSTIL
jgi:hypothetical protein